MTFIQATQGGGGWPMNVFLTPSLAPFIGGALCAWQHPTSSDWFLSVEQLRLLDVLSVAFQLAPLMYAGTYWPPQDAYGRPGNMPAEGSAHTALPPVVCWGRTHRMLHWP